MLLKILVVLVLVGLGVGLLALFQVFFPDRGAKLIRELREEFEQRGVDIEAARIDLETLMVKAGDLPADVKERLRALADLADAAKRLKG